MVPLGSFLFHIRNYFLQYKGHFWGFLIHFSISTKGSVWCAIDAPYFLAIKSQIMAKMEHKNPSNYFLGFVAWDAEDQCDSRMFLASTLEIVLWRMSEDDIWSLAPHGVQNGRRSRFPFPVAGSINRRAVPAPNFATFWRRNCEEHSCWRSLVEKSNFSWKKLNWGSDFFLWTRFNLPGRVLNLYQHCEAKVTCKH